MSFNLRIVYRIGLAVPLMVVSVAAGAQSGSFQLSDMAGARLAWAERHAAFVCQPLAERGEVRRAAACFDRVARVRAESRMGQDATGSLAAPAAESPLPPPRPSRCAGIRCIEMLSFQGAGY